MSVSTHFLDYSDAEGIYEAFVAVPDVGHGAAVLVSHAWGGQGEFEQEAATRLAGLGYVGVAIDVYGKGKRGSGPEENQALMSPFMEDRAKLQRRLTSAIEMAAGLEETDGANMAAIGFCFGGLCVLDMARIGAGLKGVVSFHGLLRPAGNIATPKPKAKILALHGWDDPLATPDEVVSFGAEMTGAGADWQLYGYGGTVHAFTNPEANDRASGNCYDPDVTRRAWAAADDFLGEVLA